MANPTLVPSNVPKPLNLQSNGQAPSSGPGPANGNVRIKSEPAEYGQIPQYTGYQPNLNYDNQEAKQRAAALIGQRFGTDAESQVNKLTAQSNSPHSVQRPSSSPSNIQLPQATEQQRREYVERQRQQQARQMQQAQQAQQRPAVANAQTDGADEWNEMVAQRRAAALAGHDATCEVDLTMREHLEQMSQVMEGGGLMMPLSERPKQSQPRKRKAVVPASASSSRSASAATQSNEPNLSRNIPQLDGIGDLEEDEKKGIKPESDLEDDEDAINSDLDDPDDDIIAAEQQDDEQEGQIMLCTYDKVARVKNKWKCTLKDGVLTTGGKE